MNLAFPSKHWIICAILAALTQLAFAPHAFAQTAQATAPAANPAAVNAAWNGFVDAMKRSDIEKGLSYFSDKAKYRPMLSGMGANMPKFAASMSPLHIVEISPRIASGIVDATVDGKTSRHYVSFMFINGAWLIHSL